MQSHLQHCNCSDEGWALLKIQQGPSRSMLDGTTRSFVRRAHSASCKPQCFQFPLLIFENEVAHLRRSGGSRGIPCQVAIEPMGKSFANWLKSWMAKALILTHLVRSCLRSHRLRLCMVAYLVNALRKGDCSSPALTLKTPELLSSMRGSFTPLMARVSLLLWNTGVRLRFPMLTTR